MRNLGCRGAARARAELAMLPRLPGDGYWPVRGWHLLPGVSAANALG
jgi:hypothetical protein